MEIECPFCGKGKIRMYHKEGYIQSTASSISSGKKFTSHKVDDSYIVQNNCPECGKTKEEIQRAFETGETKQATHEERLKRLREAGLPERVEE
jgi:predicted RNA-binding Zn-ribbon protein involved in translation (DUF1610 family)